METPSYSCDLGIGPRKLSIRPIVYKRPVSICLQSSSIIPMLLLAILLLLQYENFRWALYGLCFNNKKTNSKTIQKYSTINNDEGGGGEEEEEEEGRKQKDIENPSHSRDNSKDRRVKQNMAIFHGFSSWIQLRYLILAICSGFPIFYNHDMLFLYINDNWLELFQVQLFFTITDDLCLLLRWNDHRNQFWECRLAMRLLHVYFNIGIEIESAGIRNILFLLDDLVALYDMYYFYKLKHFTLRRKTFGIACVILIFGWFFTTINAKLT